MALRFRVYEHIESAKIKRRFSVVPRMARVDMIGEVYEIVWLEWVKWSDAYRGWVVDD